MKRKYIIIGILVVVIICVIMLFMFSTSGKDSQNKSMDEIRVAVEKVLRIQHGLGNKNKLESLTTEDFQKQFDDMYYLGLSFYRIDRNFMDSYEVIDADTISLYFEIHEIGEDNYAIVTLVKTQAGKYLVSDIEYDP